MFLGMKNQKHIMVYEGRFLASLEMTAKQKEKKKALSGGEAAAKRPPSLTRDSRHSERSEEPRRA